MIDLNSKPDLGDVVWKANLDDRGVVIARYDHHGRSGADDESVVAIVIKWDDGSYSAMEVTSLQPHLMQ